MPVKKAPNGHVHLTEGSRKLWGTDEPPFNLIPDAWTAIPITLSFPDFAKDVAYGFNLFTTSFPVSRTDMYGLSLVKMLPAETWLPDITLGSVPAGINYVDWRVIFNWTQRPSRVLERDVTTPVGLGKETDLRGGSGLLEISGGYRRMMHVGLSGQTIVLSRKQSTRSMTESADWSPGNATHYASGGPRPGWTYGSIREGKFVAFIDRRSGGNNVWRGGSSGASLVDPTNYASTWSGTLLVKPGRYNPSI